MIIAKGELTPGKPLRTLRFARLLAIKAIRDWTIWKLRPSGVAFLLGVEALTVAMSIAVVVATPVEGQHTALLRLAYLVAISAVYAEVTDRVERVWVWLHTDRGAWVSQGSILCFAGVLVLPMWAALVQAVLAYGHIGIRNKRYATAPAHRWVWTCATVLVATFAFSYAFHALGGTVTHLDVVSLLVIVATALVYSGVNLGVLLTGMYLALRPPSFRALVPKRSEFSYEAAKLLLGLVAGVLLIAAPLLTPAVLVFAAMLHRSTLVGELHAVAATDDKTGLLTHRAWREQASSALTRCAQSAQPAALVLLDLDHFKRLNDTHGHTAGDRALAAVGEVLADETRAQDCVGRYGGEEFVVLLPGVGRQRALDIAQRLRERIAGAATGPAVTASLGVAGLGSDGRTLEQLLEAADTAMYRAKRNGRNAVCAASAA